MNKMLHLKITELVLSVRINESTGFEMSYGTFYFSVEKALFMSGGGVFPAS